MIAAVVLVWAGVAVVGLTSWRLLADRRVYARLHLVGPGTALGVPLVITGLALVPGTWSSAHDVLKLAVIGILLFVTGPAALIATGHAVRGSGDG